jgi:hypothetical protein
MSVTASAVALRGDAYFVANRWISAQMRLSRMPVLFKRVGERSVRVITANDGRGTIVLDVDTARDVLEVANPRHLDARREF